MILDYTIPTDGSDYDVLYAASPSTQRFTITIRDIASVTTANHYPTLAAPGDTIFVTAEVRDPNGVALPDAALTWDSASPYATITPIGNGQTVRVVALTPGSIQVHATASNSIYAHPTILVLQPYCGPGHDTGSGPTPWYIKAYKGDDTWVQTLGFYATQAAAQSACAAWLYSTYGV
jgi:hypothetical protein